MRLERRRLAYCSFSLRRYFVNSYIVDGDWLFRHLFLKFFRCGLQGFFCFNRLGLRLGLWLGRCSAGGLGRWIGNGDSFVFYFSLDHDLLRLFGMRFSFFDSIICIFFILIDHFCVFFILSLFFCDWCWFEHGLLCWLWFWLGFRFSN